MRSSHLALLCAASIAAGQWQPALPGYHYEFPRDHFAHPEYQTEWWYYTGNLRAADGHRFGFELTFFREGIRLSAEQVANTAVTWKPDPIYLAHLAVSDIDGREFYHAERVNRAGPGLAGISLEQQRYWNGNWQVRWKSFQSQDQELEAVADRFSLKLDLTPEKPLVIHGQNGIDRKGPLPAEASHYISFTRLRASGTLEWKSKTYPLDGVAWMDHEFFSEPRDNTLAGWDWFAIQLDNDEELMLYRLRRTSGARDSYSSGTFIDASGQAHSLSASEFSLMPVEIWQSPASGAGYPISWSISVPSLGLALREETALPNQELFSTSAASPSYWEGAVTYTGRIRSQPVKGIGYLEMTGYAKRIVLGAIH